MDYYNRKENGGVCVVKRKDESDEDLLRRFRKKFAKSGIMKEYKDRLAFEKPSDKKRRKRSLAQQIQKQEDEKREKYFKKSKKIKGDKDDD